MIRRYNSYIIKSLLWSATLITFSLTSIIWLTQALRFIDFIVNRGVGIDDFLYLTALMLPSLLLIILPIALFCSVIFTYNKLMSDRELVVLNAAGLSRLQLAKPAVIVAVLFTVIGYYVSASLLPVTFHKFREMQHYLRDNYASLLLQEQVFNMPVDGLTVFIRERDAEGVLHGILVHDSRVPEAPVTMIAQRAKLLQGANGPSFMMEKGSRQEFAEGKLSALDFDAYTLDIAFYSNKVVDRQKDPRELTIPELFADKTADMDEKSFEKMRAHAHQRVTWPFLSISLTLLAMTFLLKGQFNRRGQPVRLVAAAVLGTGLVFAAFAAINLAGANPAFAPLVYIIVIGGAVISLFALWYEPASVPKKVES